MTTTPLAASTRKAYDALAEWIASRHRLGTRIVGVNGAQGSGKSTLCAYLEEALAGRHYLDALTVSLDDLYLGRAARVALAERVHPLLATRGVPGTHDVMRGIEILVRLRHRQACTLPKFSKATDDALGADHDREVASDPDIVLFEGWCVGTPPQDEPALAEPVNELERNDDPDGRWRRWVNGRLAGPYAEWFREIDALVFLRVPGWAQVRQWRGQQERETAQANGGQSVLLDDTVRERFLQHYQRLTEHALRVLPEQADAVLELDERHEVARFRT